LRVRAQGQGFEQLPELKLPRIDGADVYPDKETPRNRDDGTWLYGERERKFAIVPNRAGKLTLPPFVLTWWDTQHDRAATADWPAVAVVVAAAAATTAAPAVADRASVPARQDTAPAAAVAAPAATTEESGARASFWRTTTLGVGALWLATLAALLFSLLR